jgi:hypothetical protein
VEVLVGSGRAGQVAQVALVLGIVVVASVISLAIFFAIAGPFGSINDWLIGLTGLLTIALVAAVRSWNARAASTLAVLVAVVGGAVIAIGAGLVISGTTGFLLAGLVESVGFALVGWWVIEVSRSTAAASWPAGLRRLGVVTGALLLVGIVAVPSVVAREDDMATASTLVWIAFIGWLGAFVGYPAWALWLSRVVRRSA